MKWLIWVLVICAAACTLERDPNHIYTSTGQDLGSRDRHTIDLVNSKVSFAGADDPVKSREAQNLKDRYVEYVTLKNGGAITYGKLFYGGFAPLFGEEERLQQHAEADVQKSRGIVFSKEMVKRSGQFVYFVQSSASSTCFLFHSTFGTATGEIHVGSRGNQEAYGGVCFPASSRTASALETEMLEYLGRVRFDDGEINRSRAASSPAPVVAASSPSVPVKRAAAVSPSTTNQGGVDAAGACPSGAKTPPQGNFAFAAPAVGTRFVTGYGYFQVIQVDGMTVWTVNAKNRSAKWLAGFVYMANQADKTAIEGIWPLQVGKKVIFEERAGSDIWQHTLSVVREEDIKVAAGNFPTLLIEERVQSLTPKQGNVDITKSYWYSPACRWVMKRKKHQVSGPRYTSEDYEISGVVSP